MSILPKVFALGAGFVAYQMVRDSAKGSEDILHIKHSDHMMHDFMHHQDLTDGRWSGFPMLDNFSVFLLTRQARLKFMLESYKTDIEHKFNNYILKNIVPLAVATAGLYAAFPKQVNAFFVGAWKKRTYLKPVWSAMEQGSKAIWGSMFNGRPSRIIVPGIKKIAEGGWGSVAFFGVLALLWHRFNMTHTEHPPSPAQNFFWEDNSGH